MYRKLKIRIIKRLIDWYGWQMISISSELANNKHLDRESAKKLNVVSWECKEKRRILNEVIKDIQMVGRK